MGAMPWLLEMVPLLEHLRKLTLQVMPQLQLPLVQSLPLRLDLPMAQLLLVMELKDLKVLLWFLHLWTELDQQKRTRRDLWMVTLQSERARYLPMETVHQVMAQAMLNLELVLDLLVPSRALLSWETECPLDHSKLRLMPSSME